MYERNAIVLERYFNKIFNFNNESNLRENYYNYCKFFDCYKALCDAKKHEEVCKNEFEAAEKEIAKLQKSQERLYNKGAKFEYSRYVIFNNIEEMPEKIEKHLNKVVEDVQKNSDELKELGEMFVQSVSNYNQKSDNLSDAIEKRKKAQRDYDEIYNIAAKCYKGITDGILSVAKEFVNSENKELKKELQETFVNNGKKERNQFDADVISNTINKSIEIYKIELDVYINGYDRIAKLFEEIEADFVKIDKHNKYYKDSEAKIKFITAEKEYIVQFLDNERIGAIYDKKVHRKLMLEACKKFVLDFEQIDKLYEIITKEIAGRSTKKIYKENYNKNYLIELENSSVEPSLDTGKMRQDAIAFVNLNYWRIEGIRAVYDAFEEVVTTIYEKDLTEFIPEEVKKVEVKAEDEEEIDEYEIDDEEIDDDDEFDIEEIDIDDIDDDDIDDDEFIDDDDELELFETIKSKSKQENKKRVYYSSKRKLAKAIYNSLQIKDSIETQNETIEDVDFENDEQQYSVSERVDEILGDTQEENSIIEDEEVQIEETESDDFESDDFDLSKLDDIEYEEDNISVEDIEDLDVVEDIDEIDYDDDEEDSILEYYFKDDNIDDETKGIGKQENSKQKGAHFEKKSGIFQKLAGLNSKKKREA